MEGKEDEALWRNPKDKEINIEGKELLGLGEDREWDVRNEYKERMRREQ